jgi:hypothetical protein
VSYSPGAYPLALLDANKIADPDHDWGYTSRGNDQTPRIPTPRGKVLGGSSAVNATVALRARAADFAKWGEHGAEGWPYDDVLPAFKLLENTPSGDDEYHGRTGPLPIRQRTDGELTPSLRGFVEAAVAHGFKRVHDFNGAEQNGADGYPVDVVDGVRQNVRLVYLTAEVRRRPNLTIRGDVNIDRVLFDGRTAIGVLAADGTVYRGREVILSGGTYGSPAILLRSGVGPADELTVVGIGVVADLPVGQRLQDQPGYYNAYALALGFLDITPAVGSLLWTVSREAAGDELDLHVTATHLMDGSLSPTGGAIVVMAALVQPESTGTLKLASRDPGDAPLIDAITAAPAATPAACWKASSLAAPSPPTGSSRRSSRQELTPAGGDRDFRHRRCPFSQDPDDLGDGKLADPGTGEGCDGVGQRGCGGGDADLADAGRWLGRFDQEHVDLRHRLHPHDRVAVEVLGDDLAAVAEYGLAPGGGAQRVDEPTFDLGADQVRVDGDAAVEREGDPLDMDPVAIIEGDLGDLGAVAVEEAAGGDAAGAAFGQRGSPAAPLGPPVPLRAGCPGCRPAGRGAGPQGRVRRRQPARRSLTHGRIRCGSWPPTATP